MADHRDAIDTATRREGRGWKAYVLGAAVFLLVVFVIQNSQKVQVKFLFTETQTPLIFALIIAGALGALIGWAWPHVRRGRRQQRDFESRD